MIDKTQTEEYPNTGKKVPNTGKIQICIIGPGASEEKAKEAIRSFLEANTELDIEIITERTQAGHTVHMCVSVGDDFARDRLMEYVHDYDPQLTKKIEKRERREFRSKRERRMR